jgi:hypothetical protein
MGINAGLMRRERPSTFPILRRLGGCRHLLALLSSRISGMFVLCASVCVCVCARAVGVLPQRIMLARLLG